MDYPSLDGKIKLIRAIMSPVGTDARREEENLLDFFDGQSKKTYKDISIMIKSVYDKDNAVFSAIGILYTFCYLHGLCDSNGCGLNLSEAFELVINPGKWREDLLIFLL